MSSCGSSTSVVGSLTRVPFTNQVMVWPGAARTWPIELTPSGWAHSVKTWPSVYGWRVAVSTWTMPGASWGWVGDSAPDRGAMPRVAGTATAPAVSCNERCTWKWYAEDPPLSASPACSTLATGSAGSGRTTAWPATSEIISPGDSVGWGGAAVTGVRGGIDVAGPLRAVSGCQLPVPSWPADRRATEPAIATP